MQKHLLGLLCEIDPSCKCGSFLIIKVIELLTFIIITSSCTLLNLLNSRYLYLATSEMSCSSGGRGILIKFSLCYSIVYCYNVTQRYEKFLQVGRLYRALILLGLSK